LSIVATQRAARDRRRCRQRTRRLAAGDLRRRRAARLAGQALAGDEFAEQDAECVDVGRGRDQPAFALLRRSVSRRERRQARLRFVVPVEQLGDAEVEQLDLAICCHEHVRRLEVAVHDQRAMRRFDGAANLEEQTNTSAQVEAVFARVVRDRSALDEIERDVGQTVVGNAAFDQSRNAGMLQLPKGQALAPELTLRIGRVQAPAQDFQSDLLAHPLDFAARMEHGRRTAPRRARRPARMVRCGCLAEEPRQARHHRSRARRPARRRKTAPQHRRRRAAAVRPGAQRRVGAAQVEKRGARGRLQLDRGLEQVAQ
jgi:hypothetical protein